MKVDFNVFFSALCDYKSIHNDVKIPLRYVIAEGNEAYPKEIWGLKLGQRLSAIRHGKLFTEHKQQLIDLGVDFTINKRLAEFEFDVVYDILQTYKFIHGSLNVPGGYVIVEGDEDYPEETWGLKLGHRLSAIRRGQIFAEHKQKLMDLGVDFTIRKRTEFDFDVIYAALQTYKNIFGNVKVPFSYVVTEDDEDYPEETWGLKLGHRVFAVRQGKLFTEHKQQLIDLGVDFTTNKRFTQFKFDVVYDILQTYKFIHGSLNVPGSYVIVEGDEDYPEETWGLKLGHRVSSIRQGRIFAEHKQKLMDLGVDFTIRKRTEFDFDVIYAALQTYKNIFGNLKVPYDYVITEDDESYPEETWGMKLGKQMCTIRRQGAFKEHKRKLIDLGVDYSSTKSTDFDVLFSALCAYKAVNGNLTIPQSYVIAEDDDDYPEETWGLKLGQKLCSIRYGRIFADHKQQLIDLGVDFTINKRFTQFEFDVVYDILQTYKFIHGSLNVPGSYVIAEGDEDYPEETWGLKLGHRLSTIRRGQIFAEHKQKLMDLGVDFTIRKRTEFDFDVIYAALQTYKNIFGNVKVPCSYVIADDESYPEETWGLKLGQKLSDIRRKNIFNEHKQELLDLGVDYTIITKKFSNFDVIFSALCAYKAVYGNLTIPRKYVIAEDDEAYPEETRGMKLGQKLYSIRCNGAFKEHKQELIDLGVDYTIITKTSTDLDVLFSALCAYKAVYDNLTIPVDFVIAEYDEDYPEETWGMKLGQKLCDIRHKGYFKEHRQKLIALGVDFSVNKRGYDVLYSTLETYKYIHGNLKVPYDYVIAEDDEAYPEETWGLKLGQKLCSIRCSGTFKEHKQELIDLGVDFSVNKREFDVVYSTLETYKNIHGNVIVPYNYVIAEDDEAYPEETWGLTLGQRLESIICDRMFNEHKQTLIDLGVDYDTCRLPSPCIAFDPQFDVLYNALSAYKAVYGNLQVPLQYVISEDDEAFPHETWGLKLGQKLKDVRYNGTFNEHKQKLIELGVDYTFTLKRKSKFKDSKNDAYFTSSPCITFDIAQFDVLCDALRVYRLAYGDLKVPQDFVIALYDERFAADAWGMEIGRLLNDISSNEAHKQVKQKLIDLGVDFSSSSDGVAAAKRSRTNAVF